MGYSKDRPRPSRRQAKSYFKDLSLYIKPQKLGFYGQIYLIKNLINNKLYVGQTIKTLGSRFSGHKRAYDKGEDRPISNAIHKHGISNFIITRLAFAKDREELDRLEQQCIIFYDSRNKKTGYNIKFGGNSTECPQYVRDKISKARKGKPMSGANIKGAGNSKNAPVTGRCAKTGIEHEFVSISEASRQLNVDVQQAFAKARRRSYAGGYIWRYSNEDYQDPPAKLPTTARPVRRINPSTGEVKIYPNIAKARPEGFWDRYVIQVCKGQRAIYKGFKWEYV